MIFVQDNKFMIKRKEHQRQNKVREGKVTLGELIPLYSPSPQVEIEPKKKPRNSSQGRAERNSIEGLVGLNLS